MDKSLPNALEKLRMKKIQDESTVANAISKQKESRRKRKPSYYVPIFPLASVYRKGEAETIATNIMKILVRTGDTFRDLPWDEYKKERLIDAPGDRGGGFIDGEKKFFRLAMVFCLSDEQARKFSKSWS